MGRPLSAPLCCALAAAVLVGLAPGAAAGLRTDPEVTDPLGDAQALGLPLPAGFGWADLQAAWFEHSDGAVQLSILVDGGQPPQGEVGVTFRVGAQHYIAGYTVVPGLYAGGFLSPSDADGDVPDSASPTTVPGEWTGNLIKVTFPAEELGDLNGTLTLAQPWAWAEARASNGELQRVDKTAVGRDFTIAPASGPAPGTTTGPSKATPGAATPLLLAALAAAGLLLRRR